jgi:hypothetical protein
MKESESGGAQRAIWLAVWGAMLVVSAGNTLLYRAPFSGKWGLIASGLLAALAGVLLLRRREERRDGALGWVMLVVFCAAQLVMFARTSAPPSVKRGVDFSAYYLAGKVVAERPAQSLYDLPLFADGRLNLNTEDADSSQWHAEAVRYGVPFSAPYIYPPFFAVMMRPLARLPFATAYLVWTVMSMAAVIGGLLLTLSLAGVRVGVRLALVLGVGLFSYYPLFDNLFFGQISGVILLLFAVCLWLLTKKHDVPSALCLALATAIKLTPVLVVPVLIFHRRWKWLAAYAVWCACLLGISVGQAGWAAHAEFLHKALPSMACGSPVCQNASVVAWVQELFLGHVPVGLHPPKTIPAYACAVSRWVAIAVYLLLLGRCWLRRSEGFVVRDVVVMVLLGIAVSPISWWHHYTLALLPFVYLWGTMPAKGNRALVGLFVVVATNLLGFVGLSAQSHAVQLALALVVPGMMVAVAWIKLGPGQGGAREISETDGGVLLSN